MRRVGAVGLMALAALVPAACDGSGGSADDAGSPPATAAVARGAGETSPSYAPRLNPPSPPPAPREFTVVATGDVLLHERLWTQAQRDAEAGGTMDFSPQLAGIRPVVNAADLAICHMETPLAADGGPYAGYPMFSGPPQIAGALTETGYDACTTASNHTFDQGSSGVDRTLDTLDDAGLAHAGSARTPDEAKTPTLYTAKTAEGPVVVGMLSYTYGFNGIPYPDGDSWRANVIDKLTIIRDAAKARAAGAEFVVVSLHWGDEYSPDPNQAQRDLAPQLLASDDIDLLLGHHAHVVQPMENIDGEWVAYGLGNLMAAQREPDDPRSEGLLVRFTVTENPSSGSFETTGAEYLPLLQTDAFPVGVVNVPAALEGSEPAGTASTSRLQTALDRTTEVVDQRDAIDHGLTILDQ